MTDPRAALAEVLAGDVTSGWNMRDYAAVVERDLAERGVLLVTEERLAAAIHATHPKDWAMESEADRMKHFREDAAAIFAALSGETEEEVSK